MAVPKQKPDPVEVSVSELIALRHSAESLNLRANRVRAQVGQTYLSPFKGRGMEFEESRPYQPGDDIRSLDWKVTARTGKTHTKVYREERERPVIIAVDYRPAMFFATRGAFKSAVAARIAALFAWKATTQGDRLGGFVFSANEHHEWRPKLRASATLHFLEQLATLGRFDPQKPYVGAPADALNKAIARLRRVAHPGSLLIVISDFRELDHHGEAHLAQLARHNELVLVFVYDPLETDLPPAGQYRVMEQGRELLIDTTDKQARIAYRERFRQRRERTETLCKQQGMTFLPIATDEPLLPAVQRGLRGRRV